MERDSNAAFRALVGDSRNHQHRFTLWPRNWTKYDPGVTLEWDIFPFTEDAARKIPNEPGLYAFLIQPKIAPNLNASYLMYVGKTTRTLRTRFREYLREVRRASGRPKIVMLQNYRDFVYFSCAQHRSPNDIEDKMINALIPPVNSRFSGEVRRIVAAWT